MMEKILIQGTSSDAEKKIKELIKETWHLKYVTVFFEKANFLVTKYIPLSNSVHLILEMEDETEIHIEAANCGYGGTGPNTTLDILELFGLNRREMEEVIYINDAVKFSVKDGKVIWSTLDTEYLFYPRIREGRDLVAFYNKIPVDKNVRIDLEKKKVWVFNPQRVCWNGFLNLLTYMEELEMEYYFGKESLLENGLYLGEGFNKELMRGTENPDICGVEHVNLILYGANFRVVCLIDREYEEEVVEALYLGLTGKRLFKRKKDLIGNERCGIREILKVLFEDKEDKVYDKVKIKRRKLGSSL